MAKLDLRTFRVQIDDFENQTIKANYIDDFEPLIFKITVSDLEKGDYAKTVAVFKVWKYFIEIFPDG